MKWYEKQNSEGEDEATQSIVNTNLAQHEKSNTIMENENYRNKENNTTSISCNVNLIGNLISKEDIQMSGNIKGDIVCSKHLFVNGSITGNLSSNTLQLENATIKGDIICNYDAIINEGSVVEGNIKANSLILGSTIVGNVTVKGDLQLLGSAVIKGDVEATSLESHKGAIIKGLCNIVK